ncbi:glycoside hydrolase [Microbacterium lacus]|uniref:glycosyl hydrolase n=1 Tax=Microbacterium lacus TaxID=415217 RepID=UPI00384F4A77
MSTIGDDRSDGPPAELWRTFVEPPDEARPRAWWHWMDGNIDPAGIVRDLTWLNEVGVRGVQLFDGGMGVPLVVPEAVRPGSSVWDEAVETAVRVADELGLELAVATSSGWSATGGPWVRPEDAMKKVVWTEASVDGGSPVTHALPSLPATTGLYQDAPRWGGSSGAEFSTDWVVLAVPDSPSLDALRPETVTASAPMDEWGCLVDGSFSESITLPRDPDRWSTAWVEQHFDEPVTVCSVVVGLPGPRGFGAAPPPDAMLQASDEGTTYRDVIRIDATTAPVRTASFAPVTARRFRLVLSGGSAADALPPVAEGVRTPPVLRRADTFHVAEFALRASGRVHHAETKAGYAVVPDYYGVDTDPRAEIGSIDPSAVIDLTSFVTNGTVQWDAPPGRWRILRFGASLTGQTNGPAPADSTGLEVDKLDGVRVAAFLETHLARFGDTDTDASRFGALLSDSIEAGPQNWTERILEEFLARRGYDPVRWLPTLAGYLIGGAEASDRFLFDYRRTLAEVFADEYYGTLAQEAHRRGMTYYAEALEDGRPQIGDDLAMRSHADVPMGAMWTFNPDAGPRPTYVADLKGASSVAHVYGKTWTGSEAFTSFDQPWSWSPQALKHIADLQLSLGVTRFCIHTSPHQPLTAPPPGISLAPFLGQAFTINETWSSMARPWIDYLARCSAVLNSGRPAVDIAVFVGEEGPVTGLFNDALDTVPVGFDFDYVGAGALTDVLRVEEGHLVSAGASYRLLSLGGSSRRMTLAALTQIERLVDAGATVVGIRPECSPSLADDPDSFAQTCDRLWSTGRVWAVSLEQALDEAGMKPQLAIEGGPVRRVSRVVDGRLVTFLANPTGAEVVLTLTPLTRESLCGWDPVAVERVRLERVVGSPGSQVTWMLTLPPFGSMFVLSAPEPPAAPTAIRVPLEGEWSQEMPDGVTRASSPHPVRWTEGPAPDLGFSGTAVYHHEFELEEQPTGSVLLQFDSVDAIARVMLNGQECGVVWTAPLRVEVTQSLRAGRNDLSIHVATPWRNRLISEAADPSGEIFAPTTTVFEKNAAPLPAGLHGPVHLLITP